MVTGFFSPGGWKEYPSPEKFLKILENSQHKILAVDDERNIVAGFINAVSDKILSAYIPLTVLELLVTELLTSELGKDRKPVPLKEYSFSAIFPSSTGVVCPMETTVRSFWLFTPYFENTVAIVSASSTLEKIFNSSMTDSPLSTSHPLAPTCILVNSVEE
mgnify:CR=1 FL=1